jgi:hypothetical protein
MATLGSTYLNLIDMMKASPDGKTIAAVAELLAQNNPILDDAITVEANSGMKHMHTIRTGLPSVSWGMLYKGTPQSKSARQTVEDTTGWVEGMSSVDTRLLKLYPGREGQVLLSEAMSFIESMNQEMARGIFYHDTATTPEKFKGLSARYGALGGGGAGNQIVDGGGSGSDNTSIWFVTWSEQATHLIHPQGTKIGIDRQDKGEQRVLDADGNPYFVKEELFTWHLGLSVRDWRYNARIANVDVSDMLAGNVDLWDLMRKAYYKLHGRRLQRAGNNIKNGDPSVPIARTAIYMNSDVLQALDALGTADSGTGGNTLLRLTPRELEGKEVLTYRGIPIRETDALLNTEARVV